MRAGFSDTDAWARAVGRSTRVLLGLERGEPQGIKSVERVAAVLGVSNLELLDILETGRPAPPRSDEGVADKRVHPRGEEGDRDLVALYQLADVVTRGMTDEQLGEFQVGMVRLASDVKRRSKRNPPVSEPADRPDLQAVANEGDIEEPGEF